MEIRALYESGTSASAIAKCYGVTKNTIAGLANRRGWKSGIAPFGYSEPETMLQRLDRLEARMKEVLRRYPPGTGTVPPPAPDKRRPPRDYRLVRRA